MIGVCQHWPDWSGETCVLVASGPSAKDVDLEKVRGKARVVVINNSWKLAPWADVLYASDGRWWQSVKGCPDFKGRKITQDNGAAKHYELDLIRVVPRRYELVMEPPGHVGWFGHSGGHVLNLVLQWGVSVVKLVGYDLSVANGLHWHGRHSRGLNNPTAMNIERWRRLLDEQAERISALGVEVVNCSPDSALRNFRKGSLT